MTTTKPIAPPHLHSQQKSKIRKRQNHRLFEYLKNTMGYSVSEIEDQSGIGEQIIYKWLNTESPPEPQRKNKNRIITWLGLPEEEFEKFLNDETYHPEKLLRYQGQVIYDKKEVRRVIEEGKRLSSNDLFTVIEAYQSIAKSRFLSDCEDFTNKEETYVELNEQELIRLKKMVELTLFIKEMSVKDLLEECYYTSAIDQILNKNLEYQHPEEDLEPLLPFLPKVKTWNGVTPQAFEEFGIESVAEMKEILNR